MNAPTNPLSAAPARLIVILGPTASGKSALAIELAKRLNGEILVCDSTQVYRHFDIGTAKIAPAVAPIPGNAENYSVKIDQHGIPHHLIDLVEPNEVFTAGDYRRHALLALDDLRRRAKLPILTAGTGLYLRALLEGLADAPTRSEELRDRLRRSAKQHGATHLHKILARLDPESAARIAPRDAQKIIRAIEMRILAGKPVAEIFRASRAAASPQEAHEDEPSEAPRELREDSRGEVDGEARGGAREVSDDVRENMRADTRTDAQVALSAGPRKNALEGYAITKIGLNPPRPALYSRIDGRVNAMLAAGWLDEVRALISTGLPENVKPFQFIGYADLRVHLEGRIALADAVARIQQSTRRFAKRQLTWFRRERDVHWLESFGDAPETVSAALDLLASHS
jgi:tRNA dimethylallyltransferase